jgi:hypothetical protein
MMLASQVLTRVEYSKVDPRTISGVNSGGATATELGRRRCAAVASGTVCWAEKQVSLAWATLFFSSETDIDRSVISIY